MKHFSFLASLPFPLTCCSLRFPCSLLSIFIFMGQAQTWASSLPVLHSTVTRGDYPVSALYTAGTALYLTKVYLLASASTFRITNTTSRSISPLEVQTYRSIPRQLRTCSSHNLLHLSERQHIIIDWSIPFLIPLFHSLTSCNLSFSKYHQLCLQNLSQI